MGTIRVLVLAAAAALALSGTAAAAPKPATFQVGAATASLDPLPGVPVYAGGFGLSPPITKVHDPLEVRALYVSNGKHAVAMAVIDAQAAFSAYQDAPDLGLTGIREHAAAKVPGMAAQDIIVQATHSHAAPTLEGIWGPVPLAYVRHVHDQVVKAITQAAANARSAHLEIGTFDAPWMDNIDTQQTDSYPGWAQDGQVSVLRATTPEGASIASFASVPAHGDIVEGSAEQQLSADYFGFARQALDERLGGINIVGPATLGREETPVQVGGFGPSQWFAGVVTSVLGRALAGAHPITDDTVASAESFVRVPAHNAALLALNAAWKLPEEQRAQMADASGTYPIDRSMEPPHLTGTAIGSPLTALRIGDNAFLSMPGEPFPEVRAGIANAITGADTVVALSKAQDDWGYFYPAWAWGFTSLYTSDHNTYNVAPQAGDQVIADQAANAGRLGFAVEHAAVGMPLPTRWEQALRPGLQAMASPTWGDAGEDGTLPVTFTSIYSPAYVGGSDLDGPVTVDFGDGTTAQVTGDKRKRFTHAFTPGTHTVRFTGSDGEGNVAAWQLVVRVYPRLRPAIEARPAGGRTYVFSGSARGGDGHTLAHTWRFSDGATASGPRVRHTFTGTAAPAATLTVADGTTMTASARWRA
ncbi:MAG TPA: PKD domain-containing protein [Casimicrobiaceae bacterium]